MTYREWVDNYCTNCVSFLECDKLPVNDKGKLFEAEDFIEGNIKCRDYFPIKIRLKENRET